MPKYEVLIMFLSGPPGRPHNLSVDVIEATYFQVCWQEPLTIISPISYYLINVTNLNSTGGMDSTFIRNTTIANRVFNITGLLPDTTYRLIVVAVSQGGNIVAMSEASESVTRTTELTGLYYYISPEMSVLPADIRAS